VNFSFDQEIADEQAPSFSQSESNIRQPSKARGINPEYCKVAVFLRFYRSRKRVIRRPSSVGLADQPRCKRSNDKGEKSMRYIPTFGMVALTVALWHPGITANALQLPSGSYQQTCQNMEVRGSTLYASCKNVNGGWQNAELRDYQRCNGQIENDNGVLRCANGTGYNGGYNGNGRDARDNDRDRDRDSDRDRNNNNSGGYNNGGYRNGGYGPNGAPNGSYTQSCQNIQMSGNTLHASCQKKNRKWRDTSLDNANQCNGDIQNDNGKLRCRRG
jgi:hypothetical protein